MVSELSAPLRKCRAEVSGVPNVAWPSPHRIVFAAIMDHSPSWRLEGVGPMHLRMLAVVAALMLGAGCTTLPPLESRHESGALTDTASTSLGRAIRSDVAAHPGAAGIHPLTVPSDGFAARALL